MNSFTRIFQVVAKHLNNIVHDFWEDSLHKLLLAENRLIYLIILICISEIHGGRPLRHHSILYRITNSGETTSRHLFHEVENAAIFTKVIITCENNNSS